MVTSEAEKSKVLEAVQPGVADQVVKPLEQGILKSGYGFG
jgi:response regulator of citrate/malate metabolism